MPVRMRNGVKLLVQAGDLGELVTQPRGGEAAGHGEVGGVVGEGEVLVPEADRRSCHVSIDAVPSDQSECTCRSPRSHGRTTAPPGTARDGGGLQLREPIGHLTGGGLGGDERRVVVPTSGRSVRVRAAIRAEKLAGRQGGEARRRAAVGADAARVPELALQEECDAFQGLDRGHQPAGSEEHRDEPFVLRW